MPNAHNITSPILIGGAGRSGTSWVLRAIGHHPAVQHLIETSLAYAVYQEAYASWWSHNFLHVTCHGDETVRESRTTTAIHAALAGAFPSTKQRWAMKVIWGVESTWNVPLTFWMKAFPGARYIHCMRSPLTALPSMLGHLGGYSNMGSLASVENHYCRGHRDMLELAARGAPCLRLRLEDVAADPVTVWKNLSEFCDLSGFAPTPEMLATPQGTGASCAGAAPRRQLTWEDLSKETLEMTRQLGYDVPADCAGKSETPEPSQPTLAEITAKAGQLATENIELRRQLLLLRQDRDEQASPPERPADDRLL